MLPRFPLQHHGSNGNIAGFVDQDGPTVEAVLDVRIKDTTKENLCFNVRKIMQMAEHLFAFICHFCVNNMSSSPKLLYTSMEPVNIHIATDRRFIKIFAFLTKLLGGEYSVETVRKRELYSVIEKGEKDFAEGKGTVLTIEELRNLANEVA